MFPSCKLMPQASHKSPNKEWIDIRQYDPSHRQVAKAYRPKGDSILYALVGILQDPILFYRIHLHFRIIRCSNHSPPVTTGTPSHPLCPPSSPSGHLAPASSSQFAPLPPQQLSGQKNFPTLPPYFFLPLGFPMCCSWLAYKVVNPLAQLWGPGPNSETMKQLNSPPRRSPKIWFRFWTLIEFALEKCSLVAN